MLIQIDLDRLTAYRQLLALPVDPSIQDRFGHHLTAPITTRSATQRIADLQAQFVRHLMYRALDEYGDL